MAARADGDVVAEEHVVAVVGCEGRGDDDAVADARGVFGAVRVVVACAGAGAAGAEGGVEDGGEEVAAVLGGGGVRGAERGGPGFDCGGAGEGVGAEGGVLEGEVGFAEEHFFALRGAAGGEVWG